VQRSAELGQSEIVFVRFAALEDRRSNIEALSFSSEDWIPTIKSLGFRI
jgi:hypothetical protein